jgi:hypothetical protein
MGAFYCDREPEVMAAVQAGRWPARAEEELVRHATNCPACRDLASVAGAFLTEREQWDGEAGLPDAGHVWRQAQLKAWREAVHSAGIPITAVQVLALAGAAGLLGACFGATSAWFQGTLRWLGGMRPALDLSGAMQAATAALAGHGLLVLAAVAAILLIPAAFYFALGRD